MKISLHRIDCPKRGQPFGIWAEKFTSDLALGKEVTVRVSDTDRCGQIIAELILPNGRSLRYELVGAGVAWWIRMHFPHDLIFKALEAVAQITKRGLWADKNPVPPWEWPKMQRGKRKR